MSAIDVVRENLDLDNQIFEITQQWRNSGFSIVKDVNDLTQRQVNIIVNKLSTDLKCFYDLTLDELEYCIEIYTIQNALFELSSEGFVNIDTSKNISLTNSQKKITKRIKQN